MNARDHGRPRRRRAGRTKRTRVKKSGGACSYSIPRAAAALVVLLGQYAAVSYRIWRTS